MKLKILLSIFFVLVLAASALALPADYYIKEVIDISEHLTNPQALEVIPGGFVVIDWESPVTTNLYLLDGQGNLMNETNSVAAKFNMTRNATHLSTRITGIRVYNNSGTDFTYAVLDDGSSGKNITTLNSSDFTRIDSAFRIPSPGGLQSADNLVGFCTNKTDVWLADTQDDVIIHYGGGGNNSVNQSDFSIPGTSNTGGIDCFNFNNSESIILDEIQGIVYHTTKDAVLDFINVSNLASQGLNTFTDVAFATDPATHRPDFYILNNASKLIYHIMKRPPSVLNVFAPTITFIYPAVNQVFNSRFPSQIIPINFTVTQPNSSRSEWTLADTKNCTAFVNETHNATTIIIANNTADINYSINITFGPGVYKITLDCIANISYAKSASDFRFLSVNTFKHVLWMTDNFSVYYDSDDLAFKAVLGNGSVMSANHNITTDKPISIRIVWNNVTGNRSIYIDGELKASDLSYEWHNLKSDKIYFLSRNDTGQANAVLSFLQTSGKSQGSKFSPGTFIDSWKTNAKNLIDSFPLASYFYQFRAILRRSLTSERPVLKFVNVTFDDTLMNFTIVPDVNFLDFSFSSGTSDALPVGQTTSVPIFKIVNIGNKSFALQAASLTPFSSCFNVGLFNRSDGLVLGNSSNTINLTTVYKRIGNLAPGETADVWINASASGCTANSEFFDIDFRTSP